MHYVLLSDKDGRFYTGCTAELRARLREHTAGKVQSIAYRTPLALVYYEACVNAEDAFRRERFLKTGKGKRYLRNRLVRFFVGRRNKLERH